MGQGFFRFKQFTVYQDQCAMKVGTDGVIVGAWAGVPGTQTILDVGTGTGLIALLMAQRFPLAHITAIDLDPGAVAQARWNFGQSPFADRLQALETAFQNFYPGTRTFDLIVSNPPFFSRSLLSGDSRRNLARHDQDLPLSDLLAGARRLLNPEGRIACIYPTTGLETALELALVNGLHLSRKLTIHPVPTKISHRVVLEFSPTKGDPVSEELTIETGQPDEYTQAFAELARPFYLKL